MWAGLAASLIHKLSGNSWSVASHIDNFGIASLFRGVFGKDAGLMPQGFAMTDAAPIPLCDLNAQYSRLQADLEASVLRVLRSGQAINGPDVAAFEAEAAAYCGVKHAVGCANGTDAILLALVALDIGPGDEVILPPFTFFATVGSVLRCGATPVFVDIDAETYNLDPGKIENAITDKTRAVMPVHLYGQCAEMGPICDIAKQNGLFVIEDAAQSFGAEYQGKRCGGLGDIASFSFYPSKNLGTLGDAGMVTTDRDDFAKKLIALRNHGCEVKYYHRHLGWNARLDTLHAAMLRVKLSHVDAWIDGRRAAASRYSQMIDAAGLSGYFTKPIAESFGKHSYNQYVVRVARGERDALVASLKANKIGCEVYYPLSLHLQECVKPLGYRIGDFPVSEAASREVLALPMFPEISSTQQQRVIDACAAFGLSAVKIAA
jgi:dTDP-4-amino-4,6-dideoxygalactose transaminase